MAVNSITFKHRQSVHPLFKFLMSSRVTDSFLCGIH
nr:MAG TPA: hypothetical protein [Caudoviricetes sp.]